MKEGHSKLSRQLINIRKEKYRPAFTPAAAAAAPVYVTLRLPPRFLKWVGVESSGRILISSNGKNLRIAFFSFQLIFLVDFFMIFPGCSYY